MAASQPSTSHRPLAEGTAGVLSRANAEGRSSPPSGPSGHYALERTGNAQTISAGVEPSQFALTVTGVPINVAEWPLMRVFCNEPEARVQARALRNLGLAVNFLARSGDDNAKRSARRPPSPRGMPRPRPQGRIVFCRSLVLTSRSEYLCLRLHKPAVYRGKPRMQVSSLRE